MPDKTPYVKYIIQSFDDSEARKKPIIPKIEPRMAVNL